MNPGDEEINRTIAKFMGEKGYTFCMQGGSVPRQFTISLDALVPVWEKLGKEIFININRHDTKNYHAVWFDQIDNTDAFAASKENKITYLAALATYKAILELKERE